MPWKNRRNPADSLETCKAQPGECQAAPPTWRLLCGRSRALLVVPPAFPSRLHPSRRPVGSEISPKLLFRPFPGGFCVVFAVATNQKATAVPSARAEPFLSRAVAVMGGVVPEESCWKSRDHEFHSTCLELVSQIIKISRSGASLGHMDYSSCISGWAWVA